MGKSLDALDVALLNLLQANNVATADALARSVPLSPSAITRRVRKLRDNGWISADVAILSPALTARRLKAIVHVQLHEHAQEGSLGAFRDALRAAPEVQLCAEISGPFDMIAIVVVRDMEAYNTFADTMLAAHPAVRRYETSFVKKELKHVPTVRLDEGDAER